MRVVINTPNGNIGRRLATQLLERGVEVVGLSRSPDKVKDLADRGMKVIEGSVDDGAALERAFEGADAVFWLTPPVAGPDFHEVATRTAKAAAEAAKRKGVKRAVVLSSVGAQTGRGTGPVGVMLEIEQAFQAAVPNVTVLRPGFFMENFLRSADSIAKAGSIFMPAPADKKFPVVSTSDIGDKAAEVLLDAGWSGHRFVGVHGPADLTYNEAAAILSDALGKPVAYVQVTLDQARQGMLGAGMPAFLADIYLEMYGAILDGRMDAAEPRSPETTTKTTLAEFARTVLRPAVEAAAPR